MDVALFYSAESDKKRLTVECRVPASAGKVTLPASAIALTPADSYGYSITVDASHKATVTAGGFSVAVEARSCLLAPSNRCYKANGQIQ